jgi:ActD protein
MKLLVLAEFAEPEPMVEAARKLRESGREGLDAYSPYPVHGIDDALKLPRSKVPLVALIAGLTGATGGYVLQWWTNAVDFEINVANRPPHAWPTNIPVTFESGVLICVLTIFFGSIFYFFGLPRTYHPVFESEEFRSASLDKFWISAEMKDGEDPRDLERTLRELGARRVTHVEGDE